MNNTYTLSEAAREIEIPGLGRNKLYRILKQGNIVDLRNRPVQKYVAAGLLTSPLTKPGTVDWIVRNNVTHICGQRGLVFVNITVLEYLKDHPMPTFPRRSKQP
jgi:hypothetical protein